MGQSTGWIPLREARRRLKLPKPLFEAFKNSHLLGPCTTAGYVLEEAVEHLLHFGTQWDTHERFAEPLSAPEYSSRFISDEEYARVKPIPGMGIPPPDTQAHVQINQADLLNDTGWIAHFYLVPNYYMFPNTTELALILPPPLRIAAKREVPGTCCQTHLYPHPSGALGLVTVSSRESPSYKTGEHQENPWAVAFEQAYDVAVGVLDNLAVEYDMPLPIAHSLLIGVPSGLMNIFFAHRPRVKTIAPNNNLLPSPPHFEMKAAYALYREATSSNNPFHQFLVFWKVYDETKYILSEWRKHHKRTAVKVQREFLPNNPALGVDPKGNVKEISFEQKRKELQGPYRAALAHAGETKQGHKALTAATAKDTNNVAVQVAVVRFMARVSLTNVAATLDLTADTLDLLEGTDDAKPQRQ